MEGLLSAPPIVYLLALVPALLWGFSPILSKRGMSAGGAPLQAALVVVVVDSGLYLIALVATQGLDVFRGLTVTVVVGFMIAGAVGTALGRLAVFAGIERVGASVNSAVISARPLFATAMAMGFLGERVGVVTLVGIFVLVVGLGVLSMAKGGDLRGWQTRDLIFPVGAAFFFAAGNVLRRFLLQASPASTLEAVAINEVAALVVLAGYAVARGRRDLLSAPRQSYLYFAGSGTLTAVALLALFAALDHPEGLVAIVDPIVATAPLFTTVFAYFLLSDLESVTRGVVAGAALIVVGAALVTAGPALVG